MNFIQYLSLEALSQAAERETPTKMPLNLNHPQEVLFSQLCIERTCGNLVPKLAPTVRCNEYGALFLDMGFASSSSLSLPY